MTDEPLRVWVDQDLCTGDGLCVQYAPEVFEFDVDGLAYVKDGERRAPDRPRQPDGCARAPAPRVIDAAKECPGECIHVVAPRTRSPIPPRRRCRTRSSRR